MNKSTTLLNFPDVNVWMAVALEHHVHRLIADAWWRTAEGPIALTRFAQISILRLLTTAAAMDGKPLSLEQAWRVHDGLCADERVVWVPEPAGVETLFREYTAGRTVSPKVWGDAWLLAVAHAAAGTLVTFDRALARRGAQCLLGEVP